MAISDLIQSIQGVAWPEFLQPHVEVLLLWITWAVDYIDLDYLELFAVVINLGGSIDGLGIFLNFIVFATLFIFVFQRFINLHVLSLAIYLLWLFLPVFIVFVIPAFLVIFIYGCVIFLHIYGLRHQIREAYHTSYWNGARIAITSFWDAVGHVWHGYELDGIENVPDAGSALFIYYHGCLPLDVYYLIAKLVLHKNRSLHCVGDKFIFKIPGWNAICKVFSITAGTVEECTRELNEGNLLCIAPGGVREALFSDPNVYDILWGKRLGFARVVINARTPVIPMFTENCRESFRTPVWGRSVFRWIYEKTKMPLCPVYGGFPVKMVTHLGKPMTFDYDTVTPEEVRRQIKREVRALIRKHQRLPGSIVRGIVQRFRSRKSRNRDMQAEQIELLSRTNGQSQSNGAAAQEDNFATTSAAAT